MLCVEFPGVDGDRASGGARDRGKGPERTGEDESGSGGLSGDGDGDSSGGATGDGDGGDSLGGGSGGSTGDSDGSGGLGGAGSCEDEVVSVYMLANRSSSMFYENVWGATKKASLSAVAQYENSYEFAFGTFAGTQLACGGLEHRIDFGLSRLQAIKTEYDGVVEPENKLDSPLALAITQLSAELSEVPGHRYILLLTDDAGDFCDDGDPTCSGDAAIAALQLAASQGVRTIVASLKPSHETTPLTFISYMAQAGWGQEPAWDKGLSVFPYSGEISSTCASLGSESLWAQLRSEHGNAPRPSSCGANQPEEGNSACYLPAGRYDVKGGSATAVFAETADELEGALIERLAALDPCAP